MMQNHDSGNCRKKCGKNCFALPPKIFGLVRPSLIRSGTTLAPIQPFSMHSLIVQLKTFYSYLS